LYQGTILAQHYTQREGDLIVCNLLGIEKIIGQCGMAEIKDQPEIF
jgi:hypothetical protein